MSEPHAADQVPANEPDQDEVADLEVRDEDAQDVQGGQAESANRLRSGYDTVDL